MNIVEPKVFLIGATQLINENVEKWLNHVGGEACLSHVKGHDSEKLIEFAGRNCYRSFSPGINPNVTKVSEDSAKYHRNYLSHGHGSLLEHACLTFAFEDVSRVFCYSDDTEVLTNEGWKSWPDVRGDEKFATMSTEGRLFFEKAVEHFVEDHNGLMYSLDSEQISLLVTPNHRMWVQLVDTQRARRGEEPFGIQISENILNKRVRYQKGDVHWKGKRISRISIPSTSRGSDRTSPTCRKYEEGEFDAVPFARFLGFYLSEGCTSKSDSGISLFQNYGSTYENMKETLLQLGLSVTDVASGYGSSSRRLTVKNVALRDWLIDHCGVGALEKKVPDIVHSWSPDLISELLDACIEGDGNIHKSGHVVVYTISEQLANDLQILALKVGLSANIRIDDRVGLQRTLKSGQTFENKNPCYIVSFLSKSRQYPHVNHNISSPINNRWVRNNGYMDEMVPYKGKIYCVKVPSSGLLYVRRNGKPCWCGNTHELVRHRAGMAFSQVSLRYVRLDQLKFWLPPDIAINEEAVEMFTGVIEDLEEAQRRLAELFNIEELPFADKKKLTSSFRRIAPIGVATGIVTTFNMRALRHVISMRTTEHAEVEIRKVFLEVYNIVKDIYPLLFQDASVNEAGEVIFEYDKV